MPPTDLWLSEVYRGNTQFSLRVVKTLLREQTEFQEILIADTHAWGRVMFIDGVVMLTERDEFIYHEMLTHVPLSAHPRPKHVLVIGGGDGGTVREILKHDPEHVDLVEIDRAVVDRSRELLPFTADCLSDSRVAIHYEDGAAWVKAHAGAYDAVIVDSTDPVGPGKVLFEQPFYEDCRAALKPGGVFANQAEGPMFEPDLVRGIFRELGKVFPHCAPYMAMTPSYPMGTWCLGYASVDVSVEEARAAGRRAQRHLDTRYYNPELHGAAFALPTYVRNLVDA